MPTCSSSSSVRLRAASRVQALVQEQHLVDLPLDRVQRVERGHRLLEDHRHAVAAHRRSSRCRRADQLLALEADAAGRMPRHRIGQQLQDRQRRHRLARARFADQRQGLAAADVEAHALHRAHGVGAGAEGDREVADLEQRCIAHASTLRGSKASRTASPMNTSSVSISAMTTKAVKPSHGALRLFLPCSSSSPSEGEPGGRPKPRKSSEVRVVTEPARMKGR